VAVRRNSVVLSVLCIFGAERGSGRPALLREDLVAKTRGVVCPGSVLRVIGDTDAAVVVVSVPLSHSAERLGGNG
jgi:hypothetical protein